MLKWILVLAAFAAVVAFFTRPSEADVELALRGALYQHLLTAEPEAGDEILGTAALIACRVEPSACYDLLRQGLEVTYDDRWLYVAVDVDGFRREARCYGAFTRFFCPDGFRERAPG